LCFLFFENFQQEFPAFKFALIFYVFFCSSHFIFHEKNYGV
jgi:hypothetical protein